MGVGTPSDILGAINMADMFDCVYPTKQVELDWLSLGREK